MKVMALTEAIEGEVNRWEAVQNGMLSFANEEFDKESGGYQIESEEAEMKKSEGEPSPKETASKKRETSTELGSSNWVDVCQCIFSSSWTTVFDHVLLAVCFAYRMMYRTHEMQKRASQNGRN
ncbi:hypothetical protein Tco_0093825 [Tanacetum coccineum]